MKRLPTALRSFAALGFATLAVSLGVGADLTASAEPAANQAPLALLDFRIVDGRGGPIPGRLTLLDPVNPRRAVLAPLQKPTRNLAVRANVISSANGSGRIAVRPGRYTVVASRGPEWSIDLRSLNLEAGRETSYRAVLTHEVDPGNWKSGDFHLHTVNFSGHSDATVQERIVTLLAEGLDLGVATDHNHNTDYRNAAAALKPETPLEVITGNEVSMRLGHFNVFPLDPDADPAPFHRTPAALIQQVHDLDDVDGAPPLIQVNHPRSGTAYFTEIELDPVTGTTPRAGGPGDFDLLEVLNGNEGFGFYDADLPSSAATRFTRHWALGDWFNLLNRGHRYTAVGNSDSHHVAGDIAGYPRNYVWIPPETAEAKQTAAWARALKEGRSFVSLGPFIDFTVNGARMGSDVRAPDGNIELSLRVQAASWIDVDRVKIIVNGDVIDEIPVPQVRTPVRLQTNRTLEIFGDSWLALVVEGDDSLTPLLPDQVRPIRPLTVTNPVWIQTSKGETWISPWEQARAFAQNPVEEPGVNVPAAQRALRLLATSAKKTPETSFRIRRGLKDPARRVRLAAARAAQTQADPALATTLEAAHAAAPQDPYLRVALLSALANSDRDLFQTLLVAEADASDGASLTAWGDEVGQLTPEAYVRDWWAAGFFPTTGSQAAQNQASPEARFPGKDGHSVGWQKRRSDDDGFVDLRAGEAPSSLTNNAVAYAQTYLYSPVDQAVPAAIGSDDGFELFVNGESVLAHPNHRRAAPWQNYVRLPLRAGWNRIVMEVENGVGDFGFYFQVFDETVRAELEPSGASEPAPN